MTANSSQELADLLTKMSECLMDTVTAAQTVNEQTRESHDGVEIASEEVVADFLHFLMSAIIAPIVCFFGMAGNILSIFTWARPGMRGSTGRYLTGQAFANFGVLLMFLLCDSIHYWFPEVKYSTTYGEFFSYFGYPIFYFSIMCSIWFTVGVTVDRYIMVCWITKAKNLCSESRANLSLFLIAANSFIMNIPHFAIFTPVYPANNTVSELPEVAFTETQFETSEGGHAFEFWIHCFILTMLPWFSVLFMNVMIIVQLNKANKMMADKKTSQAQKKSKDSENQITRLLLAVTFTFLFCIGVQCIAHCLWMEKPRGVNWIIVSMSFAFGKTGIVFNSSFSFVLYCLTGSRFRVELLKMLGLLKTDGLMSTLMDSSSNNTTTTSTLTTTATTSGVQRSVYVSSFWQWRHFRPNVRGTSQAASKVGTSP